VHQQGEAVRYDDPATTTVETTIVGQTSGEYDVDMKNLQRLATTVYDFMADLLNAKEQDRYLLSGAETSTKPFNDSGTLDSALNVLLSQWKAGTISTDDFIADLTDGESSTANPDAITDTIVGYSSVLSSGNAGKVYTRVSDETEIDITALANDSAFRDIMVAAAYIKNANLGPITDVYTPPNAPPAPADIQGAPGNNTAEQMENFYSVINTLKQKINVAVDNLDGIRFDLEGARARLDELKKNFQQDKNTLQTTIDTVENVDDTEVAVKINSLQIQLEASFRITSRLQELSLTRYL
jgi:flagellar hook-associated protein 3 FlgL